MSSPDDFDTRVGTMFGRYRIVSLLGRGGMGEVYEAQDTVKGRTVALKILPEQLSRDHSFKARFQRESRAAAILQAPNVIPIHDWGEVDGALYIDMRLVRGKNLSALIEDGPLSPARTVHIVSQVAAALDAAHEAGLVHRDVKPDNVIVTTDDFCYLVDFGIAATKGEVALTMTGTQIGTMKYMAPERFGTGESTAAVDVYALACVLYECLTGGVPFQTQRIEQAIAAHMTTPPPRPSAVNPTVPQAFDEVVARGMAKQPGDRYPTAGALGRAAREALTAGPAPAPATNPMTTPMPAPTTVIGPPPIRTYGFGEGPPRNGPQPTHQQPPYQPPSHPPAGPYTVPAQTKSRRWLLPVALIVTAVVLLGAVGVVVGIVVNQNGDNNAGGTTTTRTRPSTTEPSTTGPTSTGPTSTTSQTPAVAPLDVGAPVPALITGPDSSASHEVCDQPFQYSGRTGVGTRAQRGSPETSCRFTENVLNAYWNEFGDATRDERKVIASGTVPCQSSGPSQSSCSGTDFVLNCSAPVGEAYITCRGGSGARIYIF